MEALTFKSPESYLKSLREKWLVSDEAKSVIEGKGVSHSTCCIIDDDTWYEEIYSDFSDSNKIIVFEVWKKLIIGSEHHSLGCEISNGLYTFVTEEELHEKGIP